MAENKMSVFDIVLLVVGIGASVLGFQLINQVYQAESGKISWLMIIAIFKDFTKYRSFGFRDRNIRITANIFK